jgi:hypothetical protein
MKRYLYIIIAIVVVAAVAIGVLLYVKGGSSNGANGTTGGTSTTGGLLPPAGTQGSTNNNSGGSGSPISLPSNGSSTAGAQGNAMSFGVLSSNPVAAYYVNAQNVVIAIQPDGQVFTVTDGQSSVVNSSTVSGIISASFSYNGMKALVNYGDPNAPQTEIYDVAANAWTPLAPGMLSPRWSPSDYRIAYLATTKSGGLALQTMDATGAASIKKGAATLLSLSATDLSLQWPAKGYLLLSDRPTSQNAGSIWEFNVAAGTLTALSYETPGAESMWSNDTTTPYGLVFYDSGPANRTSNLELQPLFGNAPAATMSFLTLPSKCTFNGERMPIAAPSPDGQSSSTASSTPSAPAKNAPTSTPYLALYCGVPRDSNAFSSANLPDDYNTMSLFTSDDIFKIDTATGGIVTLWSDKTQNMDISDAKVFNGTLFFVNRYDQKLYGLTNVTSQ